MTLRIAHYDEQKSISIASRSVPHIHAYLASALGDAAFAAGSMDSPARHQIHNAIYQGGAHAKHGRVHLTEAPGFGVEIDWKAVEHDRA